MAFNAAAGTLKQARTVLFVHRKQTGKPWAAGCQSSENPGKHFAEMND